MTLEHPFLIVAPRILSCPWLTETSFTQIFQRITVNPCAVTNVSPFFNNASFRRRGLFPLPEVGLDLLAFFWQTDYGGSDVWLLRRGHKGTVVSSLSLGEASCQVMRTPKLPKERPTCEGSCQQPCELAGKCSLLPQLSLQITAARALCWLKTHESPWAKPPS